MSTPDPVFPPPKRNAKKWLVGCLIALVVLVVLGLAMLMLGVYAAKKQMDSMTTDAHKIYEDARRAAKALESHSRVAPILAQGAEARMRLSRAASAVAGSEELIAAPCPQDPSRAMLPVDAEWFRELASGLPKQSIGTPWFRHPLFASAANAPLAQQAGADSEALALIALDHELGQGGSVAVIHTTRLVEPQRLDGGKAGGGEFEGFVQLIGYPDGETICLAPFSTPLEGEYQQAFWAAAEAALGK